MQQLRLFQVKHLENTVHFSPMDGVVISFFIIIESIVMREIVQYNFT